MARRAIRSYFSHEDPPYGRPARERGSLPSIDVGAGLTSYILGADGGVTHARRKLQITLSSLPNYLLRGSRMWDLEERVLTAVDEHQEKERQLVDVHLYVFRTGAGKCAIGAVAVPVQDTQEPARELSWQRVLDDDFLA
jgi:hypothetical protein